MAKQNPKDPEEEKIEKLEQIWKNFQKKLAQLRAEQLEIIKQYNKKRDEEKIKKIEEELNQ